MVFRLLFAGTGLFFVPALIIVFLYWPEPGTNDPETIHGPVRCNSFGMALLPHASIQALAQIWGPVHAGVKKI